MLLQFGEHSPECIEQILVSSSFDWHQVPKIMLSAEFPRLYVVKIILVPTASRHRVPTSTILCNVSRPFQVCQRRQTFLLWDSSLEIARKRNVPPSSGV